MTDMHNTPRRATRRTVSPETFVSALRDDGFDHGADGTLPASAGRWPAWLILAIRPRFAARVSRETCARGVEAFRLGFADGLADHLRMGEPRR